MTKLLLDNSHLLDTTTVDRALVADQVIARRREGMSGRQIAAETGLSRGQVQRILRAYLAVRRDTVVRAQVLPLVVVR